ncbi:MAG: hypothetical protein K8R36_19215 [Planctomycetales bacterium]|nr:hypothetical protein [Planctomycetales bacterium]
MRTCALPQTKERARMLLAAGHTYLQVSRRTGLSRRTVARLAAEGRRKLTGADIHDDRPAGFDQECLNRCRGCGSRIYLWPCLQCEVRAKKEAQEEVRRLVKQGTGDRGQGTGVRSQVSRTRFKEK